MRWRGHICKASFGKAEFSPFAHVLFEAHLAHETDLAGRTASAVELVNQHMLYVFM